MPHSLVNYDPETAIAGPPVSPDLPSYHCGLCTNYGSKGKVRCEMCHEPRSSDALYVRATARSAAMSDAWDGRAHKRGETRCAPHPSSSSSPPNTSHLSDGNGYTLCARGAMRGCEGPWAGLWGDGASYDAWAGAGCSVLQSRLDSRGKKGNATLASRGRVKVGGKKKTKRPDL